MQSIKFQVLFACIAFVAVANGEFESRISLNRILHQQIEALRRQLPCGINGGPPLAPFETDFVSLEMNSPPNLVSTGNATNITLAGLDGFVVNALDFNLFRMRLEYSITLPEMEVTGNYNVNASALEEMFEIWGEGPFRFVIHNSNIRGAMQINIIRGFLNVRDLDAVFTLEHVESQFEGLFNDAQTNDEFNEMVEALAAWIVDENAETISASLRNVMLPMINMVVNDLTLADVIGFQPKLPIGDGPITCEF